MITSVSTRIRAVGTRFGLFLLTWTVLLSAPSQAVAAEQPSEAIHTVLVAGAEGTYQLAVYWDGDPATVLSVWLDFDGNGAWDDQEQVVHQALLAERTTLFALDLRDKGQIAPGITAGMTAAGVAMKLRAEIPGEPDRQWLRQTNEPLGCSWSEGFESNGTDGEVWALAVFDDGSGAALYAAGLFSLAGSRPANNIVRWADGVWSPLGEGVDSMVSALQVFDDGSGAALYAAGQFTVAGGLSVGGIARWDGAAWSGVGGGMAGSNLRIDDLEVFDFGSGPALYAAGVFSTAGGQPANNLARWDGAAWSSVAGGTNGFVRALKAFEQDGAPALFVGGSFTEAGGQSAQSTAYFDGTSWAELPGLDLEFCDLFGCSPGSVAAFEAYDDGSGEALYIGGSFTHVAGNVAVNIVKWADSSWSALANGTRNSILDLKAFDDGNGAQLYAGLRHPGVPNNPQEKVARWNGSTWSSLGRGADARVGALEVFDPGTGPVLVLGGEFSTGGEAAASHLATWDGSAWAPLSSLPNGMTSSISNLATLDGGGGDGGGDGSGEALYAVGAFRGAGSVAAAGVAKWDGHWQALGDGFDRSTRTLAAYDDGNGAAIYVGGRFFRSGDRPINGIAMWDGLAWQEVGGGVAGAAFEVEALAVFDDGSGPALYVGGQFTTAGGLAVSNLTRWNGHAWSDVGGGVNGRIRTLVEFDDGSGPALYAAGDFFGAGGGGVGATRIARWDGASWTALGSGASDSIEALAVFDDGTGAALYAGGRFTIAGGTSAMRIARWDGTSWSPLGSGLDGRVRTLVVFDEGAESVLYVGGDFATAGGLAANRLARWDGTLWSPPVGGGVGDGGVTSLAVFGDALFVGGGFSDVGGVPAASIAQMVCVGIFADGFESGDIQRWATSFP